MAKDYELVGGQPVKVEPLEANEAGTYRAPLGKAYNPVTVPAGAGLPDVTSDDNGDILAVVSGAWAKSAPPSSLPSVTSDDNGDVLTVVEGEWAKAAPTGGGDIFRVSFGYDEATETDTADKTYAEVITAISAGKTVIGIDDYEGEVINFELISHSGAGVVFRGINLRSPWRTPPILALSEYSISSADIVTSDYREFTLTPAT